MGRFLQLLKSKLAVSKRAPDGKSGRGRFGEDEAAKLLKKKKKMKILARNWRSGHDEIDIVALDEKVVVFVEVRTRSADSLVQGFHSVDAKKKKRLLRACRKYLNALSIKPNTFRLDVVEVRLQLDGSFEIDHFENVPLFPKGVVLN